MQKLKDVAVTCQVTIKPEDLKDVKKFLGYTPKSPFEVLDHDIDNTSVLVSLHSDDDGQSFRLSSDTIVELKETREWKRIKKSASR